MDELINGLPIYINDDSEILILGSFPSVKSREQAFYYGNPLNRFWKVLSECFNEELPSSIEDKKELLKRHKIALFDTVKECHIVGSLDTNIKDYKVNDITEIVSKYPIKKIIINGNKSKQIFIKHFKNLLDIAVYLPSTSPANTINFDLNKWRNELINL